MAKENPFKKIEPEVSLPEELKEEILQEVRNLTEDTHDEQQKKKP